MFGCKSTTVIYQSHFPRYTIFAMVTSTCNPELASLCSLCVKLSQFFPHLGGICTKERHPVTFGGFYLPQNMEGISELTLNQVPSNEAWNPSHGTERFYPNALSIIYYL